MTSRTRVLTPGGYVEIGKIKSGDFILSWDVVRHQFVENEIRELLFKEDGVYGQLAAQSGPGLIEVQPSYPFFMPEAGTYRALHEILPHEKLLSVNTCEEILIERGELQKGGIGPGACLRT